MAKPQDADLPDVMSPADPVTVLVVDDLPASRGLAAIWLSDGLRDSVRVVEAGTLAEMRAAWRAERPDVVLLDHRLPDGEGLEASRELLAEDPDAAIVLLTGMGDPALDQEAERIGLTDFLIKHEIDGPMLARTVRYALRRREDRRRLRRSEERYRNLVSALPDTGVLVVDDALRFVMAAGRALEDAGWDPDAIVGRDAADVLRNAGREAMLDHYEAALAGEAHETVSVSPNGRTYRTAFRPLGGHEAMAVTFDITDQLAAAAELQRAQALAHTGSWHWDAVREEMTWSPELCRIYGVDPSAPLPQFGDWLRTMVAEGDREHVAYVTRAAIRQGESNDFDMRIVRADGEARVLETRVRPVPGPDGAVLRVEGISQDVTELRRAQEALRAGEEQMRLVLGNLPRAVVAVYNTELRCTLVEGGTLPSEAYTSLDPALARALAGEESEVSVVAGDAAQDLVLTVAPHRDLHGAIAGALVVARDVTVEREAERARRNAERQFEVAFDRAPIGMFLSSPEGRFLKVNAALSALVGFGAEELVGGDPLALVHHDDVETVTARLAGIADDDVRLEHRMRHRDGHDVWVAVNATLVRDDEGRPVHVLGQMRDITERREHEAQLRHLADHDPLTGLLNRRGFEAAVTAHVARCRRYGAAGALLALDLDGFKGVNDTHGHHAGDALLASVAAGLRERVRETDVLARLGGDEFAVLLPAETAAQAEVAAEALVAVVRERGAPYGVTASLGVVLVDGSAAGGDELLVRADRAMYAAKAAGRDRVAHEDPTSHA
jgi:diguanylate cyclase (GGDEF)-like protein/PAS domain S-box-containing protein